MFFEIVFLGENKYYLDKRSGKVGFELGHIKQASVICLLDHRFRGGTCFNAVDAVNRHPFTHRLRQTSGEALGRGGLARAALVTSLSASIGNGQ